MASGLPKNTFKAYIPAGNLRWKMILEAPEEVTTPTGAHTTTWTFVNGVWVELIPLHGNQMFYAQSYAPETTSLVRCRYRTDIEASMRLVYRNSAFEIIRPPIDLEGNKAVLLMYCRELRVLAPVGV